MTDNLQPVLISVLILNYINFWTLKFHKVLQWRL